ncbi:MAG: stage V sporulation protein AA [Anaeromicrobium sp.]|uniref:stage V sporulation protein AA n=1 Tax=Anaeromicrobium sp. TaxID=1929132 RepID=UPI0025E67715|nr:stage V sporulation protein AA [Anaeromicrobium sp.]MCT4593316.1 stage V sporulation protein AA [Anaeromicrobium sp.]
MGKIYIQLKKNIEIDFETELKIKHVAHVVGEEEIKKKVEDMKLGIIQEDFYEVISPTEVANKILKNIPHMDIHFIDDEQVLINVVKKKKKESKILLLLRVLIVIIILAIGESLAIMNFHEDIGMKNVHMRVYEILTGVREKRPLIIQIPYSLGIGVGMLLFFNKIVPNKYGSDPSPMEVEMSSYRKKVNNFMRSKLKKQ